MSINDIYAQPISFQSLQQFKALTPLPTEAVAELTKIAGLDIADFNEAEVRSYVIDPIVRILGYEKGTAFSVDLERRIEFLGKVKIPDYKLNLWQEDFWLIEAKRPRIEMESFGYDELAQAIEYACHPKINAALVVLCDGHKIEIFDREMSVTEPVLHLDRANLVRDFDKLRLLLEPWQVWFFQKRRVVRLVDKVFDKEFNLGRVEEFKRLIGGRLNGKRTLFLENFRRNVKPDHDDERRHIASAPVEALVDVHMFIERSIPTTRTLIDALVARGQPGSFNVLHRIFPDRPRDASDMFYAHACAYLMAFGRHQKSVQWLPDWLSSDRNGEENVAEATRNLIRACLTYFEGDEPRRVIQLAACALRRVSKVILMSNEAQWRTAEALHFLHRYEAPELSWNQIVASPEGQVLGMLTSASLTATYRFVAAHKDEQGVFQTETAKLQLRTIWKLERTLLSAIPDYPTLLKERALGEFQMTEASAVTYDRLGHTLLCLLPPFPEWKDYILKEHQKELSTLAEIGSWSARELLGIEKTAKIEPPADEFLADRFFLGDVETLRFLRAKYTGRPLKADA